jgi:Flp pilus assembly protein TadD
VRRFAPPVALAAVLAACVLPARVHAQKSAAEPPRPKLEAGADTNDAQAYLAHGAATLQRDPEQAAAAFHWATRLDPALTDALYARRVAWLLARPRQLVDYLDNVGKAAESAEMRRVDSLYYRAMTANPLFYRRFDAVLFRAYLEESVMASARRAYGSRAEESRGEMNYMIDVWLKGAGPATRAWQAYSDGRMDQAIRSYRDALKGARKEARAGLHLEMARTFALTGNADSAVAHFQVALADLREKDAKKTVRWYDSKALLEQSIAMVYEGAGQDSLAREAYGRALQEDLSYYPAHARLGMLALRQGDTTTAVSELDLAVQVKQDDAALRHVYAQALIAARNGAAAGTQLMTAIRLEPLYAAPHYLLGRLHESYEMAEDAARNYADFLARAAARDPLRADAQARLERLGRKP